MKYLDACVKYASVGAARVANDFPGETEAAAEAAQRVGATLLGKWTLVKLIGIGGMAAVYEAEHRNRSRAAVKVLHRSAALSSVHVARFRREGYVANRVGHPAVVKIFDDDVDERGSPFLVMELLCGQTLAERARSRGGLLPPEEVLEYAEQLLDVLATAHAVKILHRDIKPQNLFVTTRDEFKVLDFGIARFADEISRGTATMDGTLLGTPAFSSPEQARGRVQEVDERSDIWAVGATLFTLLSGRHVHEAETANEQLGLAMSAVPPSLATKTAGLPTALVQVVDRALAYERSDRWNDARALQAAIRWLRSQWPAVTKDPALVPEHWAPPLAVRTYGAKTWSDGAVDEPQRVRRKISRPVRAAAVIFAIAGIAASLLGIQGGNPPMERTHPELVAELGAAKNESGDAPRKPSSAQHAESVAVRVPAPPVDGAGLSSMRRTHVDGARTMIPVRLRSTLGGVVTPLPAQASQPREEVTDTRLSQMARNPFERRH